MKFRVWSIATALKWLVILIAVVFANGIPPQVWVSVCALVVLFGHIAMESLFPGGSCAIEQIVQPPHHRRWAYLLYLPGAVGLLLVIGVYVAMRREWLPFSELRLAAVWGIGLFCAWMIAFVSHRDFLIARYWPHEPTA